ncbi:hypothetical protein DOTSEDRAFT_84974 [Dothistroma septosporum NZE10]|uniref:DUF1754-domain-containing protein n=1 Tax=Dothistroma septosporum (strain NZE10 / CBS 128990) TaxID=675120 RepID=N1Q343_DOTSN|nr:hypothetical protein DOTSEDRAFT_84974 [Dothistroma septosporum NZE10]
MPSSDYSSAVGGGLKLKGAGGVDKKKKKKKKAKEGNEKDDGYRPEKASDSNNAQTALQKALADEADGQANGKVPDADMKEYGKTEAQRRFEERRKKRLDERLQKEGVKTHKERVEQLNKYLSTLSEHNDMPRIGPG